MRVACKHAHQLLETVYEAILISCSGGEVKLETSGVRASGSGLGAGLWLRDRMGLMGLMWYAAGSGSASS
jgi:hypothetical protein